MTYQDLPESASGSGTSRIEAPIATGADQYRRLVCLVSSRPVVGRLLRPATSQMRPHWRGRRTEARRRPNATYPRHPLAADSIVSVAGRTLGWSGTASSPGACSSIARDRTRSEGTVLRLVSSWTVRLSCSAYRTLVGGCKA